MSIQSRNQYGFNEIDKDENLVFYLDWRNFPEIDENRCRQVSKTYRG